MIPTVSQAMALKIGPLTWSPIRFLSLISMIMNSSTKGSTAPLTTWEMNMIIISGASGTRIRPALMTMMTVKSQKNWGACWKSLSTPDSHPIPSQM